MNFWLVMLAGGLLTYGMRLSFIVLFGRMRIPLGVQRGLRFVPPAVLTAIIFPELLMPGGALDVSLGNTRLLAGLLATLIAWRTRNVLFTILSGMGALVILNIILR